MAKAISLDVTDGVATVAFNRPMHGNTVSFETIEEFHQTLRRLRGDTQVGVVVITGVGGHFIAGSDFGDYAGQLELKPQARQIIFRALVEKHVNTVMEVLYSLHQPVVAKVRGECSGFGFSLMLACDIVLSADDAVFSAGHVEIACSPNGGVSRFLPRIVGVRKAMELMLLGNSLNADEALRLGLVNRVVAPTHLDAEADGLVARLRQCPTHVHAEVKGLLATTLDLTLEAQLEREAEAFGRCVAKPEFVDYVTAALEARRWTSGGD